MTKWRWWLFCLGLCLACPAPASAQDADATSQLSALELRSGTVSGLAGDARWPSLGVGVQAKPWRGRATADRLSVYANGDFRHLGHQEIFDSQFQSPAQLGRWALAFGGAVGVDILRTSRLVVDVRGGAALVTVRTSFAIASANGFVDDDDEWETVCGFQGFRERCQTSAAATGSLAIGARLALRQNGTVYAGADYTRWSRGRAVFVVVFGMRAP